jgi:hypothetical protein
MWTLHESTVNELARTKASIVPPTTRTSPG